MQFQSPKPTSGGNSGGGGGNSGGVGGGHSGGAFPDAKVSRKRKLQHMDIKIRGESYSVPDIKTSAEWMKYYRDLREITVPGMYRNLNDRIIDYIYTLASNNPEANYHYQHFEAVRSMIVLSFDKYPLGRSLFEEGIDPTLSTKKKIPGIGTYTSQRTLEFMTSLSMDGKVTEEELKATRRVGDGMDEEDAGLGGGHDLLDLTASDLGTCFSVPR